MNLFFFNSLSLIVSINKNRLNLKFSLKLLSTLVNLKMLKSTKWIII